MGSKIRFGMVVVVAALLPAALALGRGGGGGGHGGGGGGGHGGGGGGHGGGGFHSGGGGSFHSGGMSSGATHSFNGGSMSSGAARSFSGGATGAMHHNGATAGSLGSGNHSSFVKNNFSNHQGGLNSGAVQHQVNRLNTGGLSHSLNSNNSFVHKNGIANNSANHWTHQGNTNHNLNNNLNKNNNFNANHQNLNHNNLAHNWNHNWNNNWRHNNNFFFFSPFAFGGFGLWGWPYYSFGYGYGGYGGYGYPYYGYNYYGYGNGYGNYGYSNYGAANYGTYVAAAQPIDATTSVGDVTNGGSFIDQGEIDFKAGKYQAAARDWQHALVDDPKNGAVMMLMAQALFALGQYDEAAGATQAGMQMLPEDKWGVVISNYAQLYGNVADYTNQLKALEKARDTKPDVPSVRFLLGFHFGYLGYPKQAVRELDKALTIAPKDLGSRKIRDIFAAKWPEAPPLPAAAVEAAKEAEGNLPGPDGGQPKGAPGANAPAGAEVGTPS